MPTEIFDQLPTWALATLVYMLLFVIVFNTAADRWLPHTDKAWLELVEKHPRIAGLISFLRAFPGHLPGVYRALALLLLKRKPSALVESSLDKIPEEPRPLAGILLLLAAGGAAGLQTGCGAGQELVHAVQVSSEVIAFAEPCLIEKYEAHQMKCTEPPANKADAALCVKGIRSKWKSVLDAITELRDERCLIEPAKCAEQDRLDAAGEIQ